MEKRRMPDDKISILILYFAAFCREKKKVLSKSLLNKFLFNLDFGHYALHHESVTDFRYKKDQFGPVPMEVANYLQQLVKTDELVEVDRVHGEKERSYMSFYTPRGTSEFELGSYLNAKEVQTLKETCKAFAGKTAAIASSESHCQYAWLMAEKQGVIPIESAKFCSFEWLGYYGEGKDREDFLEANEIRDDLQSSPQVMELMQRVVSGKRTLTTTRKPKASK